MEPRIRDMHFGGLGFFNWFVRVAWKPGRTREWAIKKAKQTFEQIALHRFDADDFFFWVSDGTSQHAHLNLKTPYQLKKKLFPVKVFKLHKDNARFWKIYRIFISLHKVPIDNKIYVIHPISHLFMDRYDYFPFFHNTNGIEGFWTPEALPFQLRVAEKALQIIKEEFGANYRPWVKFINEPAHWGSHEKGHIIADWHKAMYHKAISKYTDLSRCIIDVSHSEYAHAQLTQHTGTGQCHHCDKYWDNKPEYGRLVKAELHNVSIKENLTETNKLNWIGSAWKCHKLHEDCGGGEKAEGVQFGPFRFATAEQTEEMSYYLWDTCKKNNVRAIFAIVPIETLVNGPIYGVADYRVHLIDWERPKRLIKSHKAVYGHE